MQAQDSARNNPLVPGRCMGDSPQSRKQLAETHPCPGVTKAWLLTFSGFLPNSAIFKILGCHPALKVKYAQIRRRGGSAAEEYLWNLTHGQHLLRASVEHSS